MFYENAMKFASEDIRTKAVNAYLNEKLPSKELSKILVILSQLSATGSECIAPNLI